MLDFMWDLFIICSIIIDFAIFSFLHSSFHLLFGLIRNFCGLVDHFYLVDLEEA